ncbi:pickpocket protein 28-like [Sitodiplosis mosellana]|uniref:pickpocket protein 28-like n=1 Tax=Sitodiplosis mosellana TaxID=263140 RepID=UPI0024448688|nr:pickpocket protein 28-like [Sitodiplosis mosellana]
MIAFILSVVLCTCSVWNTWLKWQERPVMVSFNDRTTSIGMVPFPAVTICPTHIYDKDDVNITHLANVYMRNSNLEKENLTNKEKDQLCALEYMCLHDFVTIRRANGSPKTEKLFKAIKDIAPSGVIRSADFSQTYARYWETFTEEGLCYSFNSLNSWDVYTNDVIPELLTVRFNPNVSHWNMEDGYELSVNESTVYPYRVFTVSQRDTLHTILHTIVNDKPDLCHKHAQGFRLSLHSPDEVPETSDDYIFVPIEGEVHISVKPNMIATSNGLRKYSPEKRGCFFRAERQLRFFKWYSQQKCEFECLSNFTRDNCGCVKFFMPRDNLTNICNVKKFLCLNNATRAYYKMNTLTQKCNCLPDCNSVSYDVEVSQGQTPFYTQNENTLVGAIDASLIPAKAK